MPPSDPFAPLRVLLVDDGAHRVSLIRDELTRQGHEVVGVIDSPLVIHDCVTRLAPDVVIVDSESPSRDTLEHVATLSSRNPRPVVVFAEDEADDPMRRAMAAGVSAYVVSGLQPNRLASVMRVAIARFEQDKALREQLEQAQHELTSRKLVGHQTPTDLVAPRDGAGLVAATSTPRRRTLTARRPCTPRRGWTSSHADARPAGGDTTLRRGLAPSRCDACGRRHPAKRSHRDRSAPAG